MGALVAWLATVLGVVGGAVGLLDSFGANDSVREWILSLTAGSVALGALATLAVREVALRRQSKFVSILSHLERASYQIRDLRIFLNNKLKSKVGTQEDLSRARAMIGNVLSTYADAYSILTATRCRTCVKLINVAGESADQVFVFTLARDEYSAIENKSHDRKRAEGKHDKLKDNSDFLRLWDPNVEDDGYYISADLKKRKSTRLVH